MIYDEAFKNFMIKFETKNGEIKNAFTFTNTFPVIKESNNYKYSYNYI